MRCLKLSTSSSVCPFIMLLKTDSVDEDLFTLVSAYFHSVGYQCYLELACDVIGMCLTRPYTQCHLQGIASRAVFRWWIQAFEIMNGIAHDIQMLDKAGDICSQPCRRTSITVLGNFLTLLFKIITHLKGSYSIPISIWALIKSYHSTRRSSKSMII